MEIRRFRIHFIRIMVGILIMNKDFILKMIPHFIFPFSPPSHNVLTYSMTVSQISNLWMILESKKIRSPLFIICFIPHLVDMKKQRM